MKLEDLKKCGGYTVQVMLDGKPTDAIIDTTLSTDGQPKLMWPAIDGTWEDVLLLPITEDDAAFFIPNGHENFLSKICLTNKGGRNRI